MILSNPIWDRKVHRTKRCSWPGCRADTELVNVHIDGKVHLYWCCTKCSYAEASNALVRADTFSPASNQYDFKCRPKPKGRGTANPETFGKTGLVRISV